MKCFNCGKKLDEVDCSCLWCTFCGTMFDISAFNTAKDKDAEPGAIKEAAPTHLHEQP